jgi:uncharacterized protein
MLNLLIFLAIAGSIFQPLFPAPLRTIRILILSGRNNHAWQQTTESLVSLYSSAGCRKVSVIEDPLLLAEKLKTCDVLVSNWNAWPDVTGRQWGAKSEQKFLDFMNRGGGLVLLHAASATLQDWPEFQQMAGATWKLGTTGHGKIHPFQVDIADTLHSVTRGLAGFVIEDELWHKMALQPDIHILCRAFSDKATGGSGDWEPVVITSRYGKGRCFYSVLGHDVKAMSTPGWQKLMLRGTEWAATGQVKINNPE